jgi:hypothetical protein
MEMFVHVIMRILFIFYGINFSSMNNFWTDLEQFVCYVKKFANAAQAHVLSCFSTTVTSPVFADLKCFD